MALDGLVIRAITHELESCVGGRISKIYQPSGHDIVMQIRAQSANHKLLLSASPTYPRVHFTNQSFINPTEAPMFCMLMRKHCEGGIIEAVKQVGMERILHMDVRQRDELGDIRVKRIIVELMGRHSNIILMDPESGVILDGIHHVTPAISSYRVVMPGSAYTPPPEQGKQNPLVIQSEADFVQALEAGGSNSEAENTSTFEQRIVQAFNGISPLAAKELLHRVRTGPDVYASESNAASLWQVFQWVMSRMDSHQYEPNITAHEASGKSYFSVIALTHLTGKTLSFSTISECLEAFYGEKAERDTVKQRTTDLSRFLQNEKAKNVKKLEKLAETMEEAKDADKYRIKGELLTTTLHTIERGAKQIEVINYYDEEQKMMRIELDPLLSPSENAQKYFKRYTKSKNSLIAVNEQIEHTHSEIEYMNGLLQQLNNASINDVEEIREELVEQGYLRDRQKKNRKKKKNGNPAVTCYTSSEGIPIYVGKNNLQNEYVTQRLASSNDTWLHTKDIPGSHVVIRSATFGDPTLNEAAQLAAYHSQAKHSSSVPVDYTLIRHVRKPSGAKPGFVIYEHQKTLFITPDEAFVKQLPYTVK